MTVYINDGVEETAAGRLAARNGFPLSACPYPKGSYASYDWIIGWIEENEKPIHLKSDAHP